MKRCPNCRSNKVIKLDSDKDHCIKCNISFPTVKEVGDECEAGCKVFTGGEIRHHKDCIFYPESRTEMYNNLKIENKKLKEVLKNMYFSYINKDVDNPHMFEEEAIKEYKTLFPDEEEKENIKTPEWYEAQIKELKDIRRAHYELYGDDGSDAYFPDLIKNKLQELKYTLKDMSSGEQNMLGQETLITKLKGNI